MATRPDQPVLGTIASLESIASVYRTTCFAGAGRSQPQIAPAEIRMASTITAYNTVLSRRLCSLPCGVEVATDGVTDGVCGDTARSTVAVVAGRLKDAARSSISESGSISSSCHEFLINPGVLYRAGAVAGGGKSEHELLRRAG